MSKIKTLCEANHESTKFYFCLKCAQENKALSYVMFCSLCNPGMMNEHRLNPERRYNLESAQFRTIYQGFKQTLIDLIIDIVLTQSALHQEYEYVSSDPSDFIRKPFQMHHPVFFNILKPKCQAKTDFLDNQFVKFLYEVKFWSRLNDGTFRNTLKTRIIEELKKNPLIKPIFDPPREKFSLPFDQEPKGLIQPSQIIKKTEEKIRLLEKQSNLTDLFIKIFSCFEEKQIKEVKKRCEQISKSYSPISFLIYLGELKILQIDPNGQQRMKQILESVEKSKLSAKQNQFFYYYMAISEWKCIDEDGREVDQCFFDTRNNQYYRMQNPQRYLHFLTMAIQLEEKPIYYAARAIGYMLQGMRQLAEKDFQAADRFKYLNDSMDSNRFLNQIKKGLVYDQQHTNQEALKQFDTREVPYLINMAKYLKKIKSYKKLRQCCLHLTLKEPQNVQFKIQYVKALIRVEQFPEAEELINELKFNKQINLQEEGQLRQRYYLKKANESSFFDPEGEQIALNLAISNENPKEPRATAYYNLAVSKYNNDKDVDNLKEALVAVNKALAIKPKLKFKELKFVILFSMSEFEKANEVQFEDQEGKFKDMQEFIANELNDHRK